MIHAVLPALEILAVQIDAVKQASGGNLKTSVTFLNLLNM
jgi:hypothetical protein